MNDVVILNTEEDWAYVAWKKNDIAAEIIFKRVNKVLRGIRRLWIRYHVPFALIWYRNWKHRICQANIIVFHVSYLTMDLAKYLNKINPHAKIIAWYWNSVSNLTLPVNIHGNCEKWSFDPENCKEYGMKFNHQYYFKSYIQTENVQIWDIYFCGIDIRRSENIMKVYRACKEQGIVAKFQVVDSKSDLYPREIVSPRVNYKEICENIASSKAILELVRKGQSGPTIRLMESLFFGKKLITDNLYVKDEEFYNEKNIFLLNERPISEMKDFLEEEFIPYNPELLDKYDVKQWLKNFLKEE